MYESAKLTGFYLAELIISLFSGRIVNLMAFSLGTEVVLSCLERLSERNRLSLVNKVVLMGGISEVKQFSHLFKRSTYPIEVLNLYSENDMGLKYLFRLSRPFSVPIGLNKVYWNEEELSVSKKGE